MHLSIEPLLTWLHRLPDPPDLKEDVIRSLPYWVSSSLARCTDRLACAEFESGHATTGPHLAAYGLWLSALSSLDSPVAPLRVLGVTSARTDHDWVARSVA